MHFSRFEFSWTQIFIESLFKMVFDVSTLKPKVSFHPKFQHLFILFIYFSHYKIWKILGCDRLPPLKEISSRDLGRLGLQVGFKATRVLPPLKESLIGLH